jgi:pimeloyl-ACP methyl ester carboxylesterase
MKQLKYLITEECHIPVIHFPKVFPEDSMVLVYSHGSGSNLEHIYNVAKAIWKLYDVAVVIYDYTGCGNSKLADGMMEKDLIAVLSWVLKLGYSISNIILCGFSLGTYPTLSMPG